MDFDIETHFVRKCVKKEYQERVLFELKSKKHREKAISRFAHSAETVLNSSFLKYSFSNFTNKFIQNADVKNCYVISNGLYDGHNLPIQEAVEFCQESYMTVILISSEFIAIKEEFEKSVPFVFVFS